MTDWQPEPPMPQAPLASRPYDRWLSPEGYCQAEFRRGENGYHIRFPQQADFTLEPGGSISGYAVKAWPTLHCPVRAVINLYHNAILPLLGNHSGGLFLHGSAVRIADEARGGAIAFLGLSRGGKTTLAGSFAKAGNAFLTEDVIDLDHRGNTYWLRPKRSKLRLFADSARHLLGAEMRFEDDDAKQDVEAGAALPFASAPVPLRQIYILGTDHQATLRIQELAAQAALSAIMPHAFILDVEDKARLRGHFLRLADLSRDIGCFALDYPREYAELPGVMGAVMDNYRKG